MNVRDWHDMGEKPWEQSLKHLAIGCCNNGSPEEFCFMEMETVVAEVERLRKALKKYGQHGDGCGAWDAERCICGFADFPEVEGK